MSALRFLDRMKHEHKLYEIVRAHSNQQLQEQEAERRRAESDWKEILAFQRKHKTTGNSQRRAIVKGPRRAAAIKQLRKVRARGTMQSLRGGIMSRIAAAKQKNREEAAKRAKMLEDVEAEKKKKKKKKKKKQKGGRGRRATRAPQMAAFRNQDSLRRMSEAIGQAGLGQPVKKKKMKGKSRRGSIHQERASKRPKRRRSQTVSAQEATSQRDLLQGVTE